MPWRSSRQAPSRWWSRARWRASAVELTELLTIPTIGIGASPACDGQILVTDDLIGLFSEFKPKFVTRYADIGESLDRAIAAYAEDVKSRRFPAPENLFT